MPAFSPQEGTSACEPPFWVPISSTPPRPCARAIKPPASGRRRSPPSLPRRSQAWFGWGRLLPQRHAGRICPAPGKTRPRPVPRMPAATGHRIRRRCPTARAAGLPQAMTCRTPRGKPHRALSRKPDAMPQEPIPGGHAIDPEGRSDRIAREDPGEGPPPHGGLASRQCRGQDLRPRRHARRRRAQPSRRCPGRRMALPTPEAGRQPSPHRNSSAPQFA